MPIFYIQNLYSLDESVRHARLVAIKVSNPAVFPKDVGCDVLPVLY
jgi:hypothetical protein